MPFTIEWVQHCTGQPRDRLITTPVGNLFVRSCDDVICQLDWMGLEALSQFEGGIEMDSMTSKIIMYWSYPMADVPVKLLQQGTLFQRKVWSELVKIRFGETITYKELAVRTGTAARAIGGACRANHFPLIIPCHRVVSVSGVGGYAGQKQGEFMSIKLKLLEYERAFNK